MPPDDVVRAQAQLFYSALTEDADPNAFWDDLAGDEERAIQEFLKDDKLLKETLAAYSDRWELFGAFPFTHDGVEYKNALLVYRLKGHETKPRTNIQIDMSRMLGRSISSETN